MNADTSTVHDIHEGSESSKSTNPKSEDAISEASSETTVCRPPSKSRGRSSKPTRNLIKSNSTSPPNVEETTRNPDRASSSRLPTHEPEDGWDRATAAEGPVLEFGTEAVERTRRLIWTSHSLEFKKTAHSWSYHKALGESTDPFFDCGQIIIPRGCSKKMKNVRDNIYAFHIFQGAVEVNIHTETYIVGPGSMFLVPRGNNYAIKNICGRDVKIFFSQARKVAATPPEEATRRSFLPSHLFEQPTSRAAILIAWLLEGLLIRIKPFQRQLISSYKSAVWKCRPYATPRRLYLLSFILGLLVRRLPFIGTLPLINIQVIRYT
ncbi:Mif2/CENP-C like-domain-containing protein [Infundibulicybe gibba]|nr:Mif2/CENP-C like-domain-containing protein [Infundibulicybe gibba]